MNDGSTGGSSCISQDLGKSHISQIHMGRLGTYSLYLIFNAFIECFKIDLMRMGLISIF